MKKKLPLSFWIIIILSTIVISFSVLLYFTHFNKNLSNKLDDWGATSDFFNLFLNLINITLLTYIAVYVHKESINIKTTLERPLLVFIFNLEIKKYRLKNVGKGAASSIYVLNKKKEGQNYWDMIVKCYSLGADDYLDVKWLNGVYEFAVIYTDIFNGIHVSRMKDDYLEVVRDSEIIDEIKNQLKNNQHRDINKFDKQNINEIKRLWEFQ